MTQSKKQREYGKRTKNTPADARLAYSVADAVASGALSSRNKVYSAIARGELRSYLDGRRRMISAAALLEYIAKRERATAEGGPA